MRFIRFFLPLWALLLAVSTQRVQAVPAYPRPVIYTQSDGTRLTIRIMGDERRHYILSSEGYTLAGAPDGDLYFARLSQDGNLEPTPVKARPLNQLSAADRAKVAALPKGITPTAVNPRVGVSGVRRQYAPSGPRRAGITPPEGIAQTNAFGKLKSLIILVQFRDTKFTIPSPQAAFTEMLNRDGYSANGATGSAWNYYHDNSNGQFDPEFVVVGPYTLSENSSYYAAHNMDKMEDLVVEACSMVDNDVNFSDFSTDGTIHDIFIYYAGNNQAETGNGSTIWPHRGSVRGDRYFDGQLLLNYACTSELRGSGTTMAGIGTFCHEFGHVLGWPDLYDTDYSGTGGEGLGMGTLSLMSSGSYNNDGCTPPALTMLERWMVGWAEPEVIVESGQYTLPAVWENKGFLVPTPTANDYFLLETRGVEGSVWDAHVSEDAQGLFVYHIDYTTLYANRWFFHNTVNVDPRHECARIIPSTDRYDSYLSVGRILFPGGKNITMLSAETHTGFHSWKDEVPALEFRSIELVGNHIELQTVSRFSLTADPGQYDALLSWSGEGEGEWHLEWWTVDDGQLLGERTLTEMSTLITGLLPDTKYEAVLTSGDVSETLSFTTAAPDMGKASRIQLGKAIFSRTEPVILRIADYPGTLQEVKWTVDGESTEDTYLTELSPGEHRIAAVVTGTDGATDYFIKYITVK